MNSDELTKLILEQNLQSNRRLEDMSDKLSKKIEDVTEKFAGMLMNFNQQISKLGTSVELAMSRLAAHEQRLAKVEEQKAESFKDMMLKYAMKALIVAVTALCSLAGGSGILKMIGM